MPYYTHLGAIHAGSTSDFDDRTAPLYSEEVFGIEGFVRTNLHDVPHPATQVLRLEEGVFHSVEYVETDVMRMGISSRRTARPGDPRHRSDRAAGQCRCRNEHLSAR